MVDLVVYCVEKIWVEMVFDFDEVVGCVLVVGGDV